MSCFEGAINAADPVYGGDLQEAVYALNDNGGMLILPPNKEFEIADPPLLIEKTADTAVGRVRTNVLITGGGMTSVIKVPDGYSGDVIKIAGAGVKSAQDIILENFSINGARTDIDDGRNDVVGIHLDLANQIITLRNLSIRNCGQAGIEAENNSCVNVFDSLRIRDCGSGVRLLQRDGKYGCNSISIINCSINNSDSTGVRVEYATNVRLTNCRIDESGKHGVSLSGVRGLMISGCRFESNFNALSGELGQVSIGEPALCEGVHIAGCYFTGVDKSPIGIVVRNSERSAIIGNHFERHIKAPILITKGAKGTSIIGNSIIIQTRENNQGVIDNGVDTLVL